MRCQQWLTRVSGAESEMGEVLLGSMLSLWLEARQTITVFWLIWLRVLST